MVKLYYHIYFTAHEPAEWTAFSIGQRDVNPYNIKVNLLTLEGQLYNSELNNPKNQLFGNFDMSFVIVFLFPLVIIALCHNLISSDRESGIESLLSSQPVEAWKIYWLRLGLRFGAVSLLMIVLVTLCCLVIGAPFDGRFALAIVVSLVYFLFWFGLSAIVISLARTTTFNALLLLGIWIFMVMLAPALLSSAITIAYPVSEAMETTVSQREGYHEKWDKPKSVTMNEFYKKYPQFKDVDIPEDKFTWGWYYAMQEMGDFESKDASTRYRNKLADRRNAARMASWLLPSINTQLQFNDISNTGIKSHLEYLDSVREFHQKVRNTYYPHIFKDAKLSDVDLYKSPKHSFKNEVRYEGVLSQLAAMSLLSVVLLIFGLFRIRSN